MRFTWTHIIFALLIARTSLASQSDEELESERKVEVEISSNQDALLDLDEELKDNLENSNLPILPPLILLDFTNRTNSTSDEKSKRTINGNLGYGFQGNNILSGNYNYYLPAGKSGTTVSIEESVSPFSPKTIVERIKPISEELENSNQYDGERREKEFFFTNAKNPSSVQNHPLSNYDYTQAFFGQRTKLQKTAANLRSYEGLSTTPRTGSYATASPDVVSSTGFFPYNSFSTTPKPTDQSITYSPEVNYDSSTTENPILNRHSTPESLSYITPAAYRANYNFNPYNSQRTILEPTSKPKESNPTGDYYSPPVEELSNYPRYTVENGVKYEHKIVWKYPDGRVLDTPPPSYVNSYSEYSSPQKTAATTNYQNGRYNTNPANYHAPQQTNYNNAGQSIYSQRPAQFPKQDSDMQKNNQFVSSSSYSASRYNSGSSDSSSFPYEVVYQNQYNAKQNTKNGFSSSSTGSRGGHRNSYNSQKTVTFVPKYAVNSPNPDYVGITENPGKTGSTSSKVFTSSDQVSSNVLSKYTPDVQNYLSKVFASGKTSGKNSFGSKNVEPQYADLLKYNPSISQYIKNPASILNAQPTFVQAGNSLIPVIILRVDGAPPVQPKATPNINLKALLQQYLTQYAQSLSDMSQDSTYDLGNDYYTRSQTSEGGNPISDLTQLTHSLSQYSQDPTISTDFQNRFPQNSGYGRRQFKPSGYIPISKQGHRQQDDEAMIIETVNRYTSQGKKPQKVKSVEIIEDPRYSSYKSS